MNDIQRVFHLLRTAKRLITMAIHFAEADRNIQAMKCLQTACRLLKMADLLILTRHVRHCLPDRYLPDHPEEFTSELLKAYRYAQA
jgi:hypothetical protein